MQICLFPKYSQDHISIPAVSFCTLWKIRPNWMDCNLVLYTCSNKAGGTCITHRCCERGAGRPVTFSVYRSNLSSVFLKTFFANCCHICLNKDGFSFFHCLCFFRKHQSVLHKSALKVEGSCVVIQCPHSGVASSCGIVNQHRLVTNIVKWMESNLQSLKAVQKWNHNPCFKLAPQAFVNWVQQCVYCTILWWVTDSCTERQSEPCCAQKKEPVNVALRPGELSTELCAFCDFSEHLSTVLPTLPWEVFCKQLTLIFSSIFLLSWTISKWWHQNLFGSLEKDQVTLLAAVKKNSHFPNKSWAFRRQNLRPFWNILLLLLLVFEMNVFSMTLILDRFFLQNESKCGCAMQNCYSVSYNLASITH